MTNPEQRHKGAMDERERILKIIRDYICAFEPTIRFKEYLIKEIKKGDYAS